MSEGPWAKSEGPWAEAKSVGSWIWLIARCWWPSWIQRAPQLVQLAIGYSPKPMVTRADRHSGQRGMRPSGRLLGCGWVASPTAAGPPSELVLKACSSAGRAAGRSRPATPPLDSTGRRVLTTACRREVRPAGAHLDAL